jgi:hypothetical protein
LDQFPEIRIFTFDGVTVHYQGGCTNRLSGLCDHAQGATVGGVTLTNFVVYGKNIRRNPDADRDMSWIEEAIVEIPDGNGKLYVQLMQKGGVKVHSFSDNGSSSKDVEDELPFQIISATGRVIGLIYQKGIWVKVQLGTDGLAVSFNGKQNFRMDLPCQYHGNVCGMLGDGNRNPADDKKTPEGVITTSDLEFGESWLASGLANEANTHFLYYYLFIFLYFNF